MFVYLLFVSVSVVGVMVSNSWVFNNKRRLRRLDCLEFLMFFRGEIGDNVISGSGTCGNVERVIVGDTN